MVRISYLLPPASYLLSHCTIPGAIHLLYFGSHLLLLVFTLECSPMAVARRLRAFVFIVSALLPLSAFAAEKPRVHVDSYAINAELNPKTHHLIAAARLKFTALDDINSASFELNNALRPRVLDAAGKPLPIERISQEN